MDRTLFYTWKWWYLQLCHFIFFEKIVCEIASFHSSKFLRFLLWLVVGSGADLCHPSWESKKMENPSRLLVELTHTWSWTPNDSTFKSHTHAHSHEIQHSTYLLLLPWLVLLVLTISKYSRTCSFSWNQFTFEQMPSQRRANTWIVEESSSKLILKAACTPYIYFFLCRVHVRCVLAHAYKFNGWGPTWAAYQFSKLNTKTLYEVPSDIDIGVQNLARFGTLHKEN